jgi:putative glutamine amidotransferase
MRPVIALSSRLSEKADGWRVPATSLGRTYQDALVRAGAQPVSIPPLDATMHEIANTLRRFDGLCLPGGPDVDPLLYGVTDIDPAVYGVNPHHDLLEISLARAALDIGMPIFAVCRGMQVLNVAMGGSLVQHLGDLTPDHRYKHHTVSLVEGCIVARTVGSTKPTGHSVHHQALDRVADGLTVTGLADDGTIEAVEAVEPFAAGRWIVGVQWHPEDDAHESAEQQALYDAFVLACAAWRANVV